VENGFVYPKLFQPHLSKTEASLTLWWNKVHSSLGPASESIKGLDDMDIQGSF
jgi:hypothetical protein